MVEWSSEENFISDSKEHILIIKYVSNVSSYYPSDRKRMTLADEFSGMGHYIFIMLSKNSNKATIIEQTGGKKVDEIKSIFQFSDFIIDYIYKYGWQLSYIHKGKVKVQPISKQNKQNLNKKKSSKK